MKNKGNMVLVLSAVLAAMVLNGCSRQTITLGSLDTEEAVTVSEIFAQALEKAGYKVERNYNRDSKSLHQALLAGEIDIYAEYTGAALTQILGGERIPDQYSAYDTVAAKYRDLGLVLLEPLPANNALGLVIKQEKAEAEGIKTYSDLQNLAETLVLVYTGDFRTNPEGLPLLESIYGPFPFKEIQEVSGYDQLHMLFHENKADVIPIESNDGHLTDSNHKLLRDNFHAFIPQTLTPVLRKEFIEENPRIREILNPIAASLNDKAVIGLNFKTGLQTIPYPQAAKAYLTDNGFIK
jgi:osmoprotectant transport system substrate-binding protein